MEKLNAVKTLIEVCAAVNRIKREAFYIKDSCAGQAADNNSYRFHAADRWNSYDRLARPGDSGYSDRIGNTGDRIRLGQKASCQSKGAN